MKMANKWDSGEGEAEHCQLQHSEKQYYQATLMTTRPVILPSMIFSAASGSFFQNDLFTGLLIEPGRQ